MAWKLQGSDPLARVLVVLSLNLLDPVLDAMETPQDQPSHREPADLRLLNPHPDCLSEITIEYPYLQERYEALRHETAGLAALDRPRIQFDLLRDAESEYVRTPATRWSIGTPHAGPLYAQSRHHERRVGVRRVRSHGGWAVRGGRHYAWEVWQMANRLHLQKPASDLLRNRQSLGRRNLVPHQENTAASQAASSQADTASARIEEA